MRGGDMRLAAAIVAACGRIASSDAPMSNANAPSPSFCAFSKITLLPTLRHAVPGGVPPLNGDA